MSSKKPVRPTTIIRAPETLKNSPFFGLDLDEEQKELRDKIWSDDYDIVFVNAKAGTGKTTISVATSILAHQYGKTDEIVYVMHPVSDLQGFLPGTITEKSSVYFEALYQAILTADEYPEKVIKDSSMSVRKDGTGYITAITDSYLRGSNIGESDRHTTLIVDEAQNFDEFSLRKVLTRACQNTKVIVIGHQLQCDLHDPLSSGFIQCLNHFKNKNNHRFAFCELNTCHRCLVAQTADESWDDRNKGERQ